MTATAKPASKYSDKQRALFREKHRDFKSGSLREGTATVLRFISGQGTCSVALESIPDAEIELRGEVKVDPMARLVAILNTLDSSQRMELVALRDGRWCGDSHDVAGLRALKLQDDALGVTDDGAQIADLIQLGWKEREALGIVFRYDRNSADGGSAP